METEVPARASRPRLWLLVVLAIVVALFVLTRMWPTGSAVPAPPPSRAAARTTTPAPQVDPEDLNVRLDALKHDHPGPGETERNPFRFQPKVVPAPPPPPPVTPPPPFAPPPGPTETPGPPPIPLKFIGIVQAGPVGKVAAFTDCRATFQGTEGSVIDGRYRLVRIGVQSVEMEYLDGRGRQTIRMSGQGCIGK